jgi:hypothetical protein
MAVDFSKAVKTDQGLRINGFIMNQIVEKCEGCGRIQEFDGDKYCSTYPQPAVKWKLGNCNFSTHTKVAAAAKAKVNPIKASKRASKGKK